MAEPLNISGKWALSRTLSTDPEEMMLLQGLNYFLRKAARFGSMSILFEHDTKANPQVINLTVIPPAGFGKESRVRTLNGEKMEDYHYIFGTNYVLWDTAKKTDALDEYFLDEEWIGDGLIQEDIFEGKDKFVTYGVCMSSAR
jgi:hypothetical protein